MIIFFTIMSYHAQASNKQINKGFSPIKPSDIKSIEPPRNLSVTMRNHLGGWPKHKLEVTRSSNQIKTRPNPKPTPH